MLNCDNIVTKDNIINITNKDTLDTILNQYVYCDYTVIEVYNEYMCRKDREEDIFKRFHLTPSDSKKGNTEVLYYRGYNNEELYTYTDIRKIAISEIKKEYKNLLNYKNKDLLDAIDKAFFDKTKDYSVFIDYNVKDKALILCCNNGLDSGQKNINLINGILTELKSMCPYIINETKKAKLEQIINKYKEMLENIMKGQNLFYIGDKNDYRMTRFNLEELSSQLKLEVVNYNKKYTII